MAIRSEAARNARLAATTALCGFIGLAGLMTVPAHAREAGVAAAVNTDATSTPPAKSERILVVGNKIVFNERIKTTANGQAQLLMMDQSAVTIGPNSELVIDKFVYDPDTRTGEMALSLSRGLMRFVGGRISKSGGVKIRTPVATMGIRGGIALFNVISPTIVDVTLLYGNEIKGVTTSGQSFEIRRPGFFTRIEEGKPPSDPQPADTGAVRDKMNKLEGRKSAAAGAEDVPTEETSENEKVFVNPTIAGLTEDQSPQEQPKKKKPPIEDDPGLAPPPPPPEPEPEPEAIIDPVIPDPVIPDPVIVKTFGVTSASQSNAGKLGNNRFGFDSFTTIIEERTLVEDENETFADTSTVGQVVVAPSDLVVVSIEDFDNSFLGVDPDNFEVGDQVFIVQGSGTGFTLAGLFNGVDAPLLSLNGVGDPDAVPNIFDASDSRAYQSTQTFNAAAVGRFGAITGAAVQGNNVFDAEFFDIDFTTNDFNGVNGARFTISDGTPTTVTPTGISTYGATGDTQNISFLPYSEIGKLQLPDLNGVTRAPREIVAANVAQTALIVDWDKGKALYVGGVFQNVDRDSETPATTERAYGIQAVVGSITNEGRVVMDGANVGSTHYELVGDQIENGSAEVRQFHAGNAVGSFMGASAAAIFMDGDHGILESQDQNDVRQDPSDVAGNLVLNHQLFQETAQQVAGNANTGIVTEQLFGGVMIGNADGDLERLVTKIDPEAGGSTLQINHDTGEMIASIQLTGEDNTIVTLQNEAKNSAFINDKTFAIAEARNTNNGFQNGTETAFIMVGGDAVSAANSPTCECKFLHWGYWAAGRNEPGEVANSISDIGMFVSGVQTPNINMPISGTATYSGFAAASVSVDGIANPLLERGNFDINVNFATAVGQGTLNLGATNIDVIMSHTVGQGALSFEYYDPTTTNQIGDGVGMYAGPNADNMGGSINIQNAETGYTAGGAFAADRQ